MDENASKQILTLEPEKRWEYLERYYELSEKFYAIQDKVVSDEDVASLVSGLKEKPRPKVRKELVLKDWKFTLDLDDKGLRDGYFSPDYDEGAWEDVAVPHTFQHVPEDPVKYGKTDFFIYASKEHPTNIWRGDTSAWYKIRPKLGTIAENEVAYLNVESANLRSDIWFNEYPVAMDHLGLFPYKMEVTDQLQAASPVIAVKVTSTASNMPHLFYNGFQFAYSDKRYTGERDPFDWIDLVWAGLADDVSLSVLNQNHIESVFVHTNSIGGGKASISFDLTLRNQTHDRFEGSADIEISAWSPEEGPVAYRAQASAHAMPMRDTMTSVAVDLAGPKLWTPDEPNLYLAHIVLKDTNGTPIDDQYEIFGVRTFEIKGSHFFLNGKKTVLHGVHESSHYRGEAQICPSHEIVAKSLLLQKRMGANCSRWPSDVRMHNKRIAQYCDQYGLMLSWAGFFDIWRLHSDVEMLSSRDVRTMIRSLRNHPCIVIWEMGDEAFFHVQEFRRRQYAEMMYDWVYAEDSTRPIIPTGDYSFDLVRYIMAYPDENLPTSEKRKHVLEEYPVFSRDHAVWDIHLVPYPDILTIPHTIAKTLEGEKPTVFTEFGFDSYPNPENIKEIYDSFRWKANPFVNIDKKWQDLRMFGREIRPEDWKVTQALHALITSSVINILRQYPKEFAAYYFLALFDLYTYYWGSVDALGNCKLTYFTTRSHYAPFFMSALQGDVVIKSGDTLRLTASNYGEDAKNAHLKIIMRDKNDHIVYQADNPGVFAAGDVSLTTIAEFIVPALEEGVYSFEYYLSDDKSNEIGKMLELAYIKA